MRTGSLSQLGLVWYDRKDTGGSHNDSTTVVAGEHVAVGLEPMYLDHEIFTLDY